MSEERRTRRRFLADLLFAGGGLAGAAFLMKAMSSGQIPPQPRPVGTMVAPVSPPRGDGRGGSPVSTPTPEISPSPVCTPEATPMALPGEAVMPTPAEVVPDGDVAVPPPEPATPGKVAMPPGQVKGTRP